MKRWMWILCGILVFQLLGETGTQVENLKPVQLLYGSREADKIILKTDTGDMGSGESLQEALANMQKTASGRIFLETADLLLLSESSADLLPELRTVLRPAVRVCIANQEPDLKAAAEYLSYHEPETILGQLRSRKYPLPELILKEGGMELERSQ